MERLYTSGRFIYDGTEKLFIHGVTYGPFGPAGSEHEYRHPIRVERDFAAMASAHINAVRTYSVPPRWLLDIAERHGLRVMVGLPWEQHVTFLDSGPLVRTIVRQVQAGVKTCAGHPALLCYSVGNEIPASIVRWHGAHRVERFLRELYWRGKEIDPDGLFTYANYPTTEYLQLPFLDLVCFNVYLDSHKSLADYVARLLNLAGDRPLVLGEIGLDSRRAGEGAQAWRLEEQVKAGLDAGSAGAFVFSWTDEWHRGGCAIEDWDFGLTRRDGAPKPALSAVAKAFGNHGREPEVAWPRISVVVCTFNGQRYLLETLSALGRLDYPDYEVIVVDDGSTDGTSATASRFPVRLIRTENRGLSSARNTGVHNATGEIVAYIDDDAYPDPGWLKQLALAFRSGEYAGVGGPNVPPADDSWMGECVANAPGGPAHVLLSDREAEHIPGCNMAFRREHLIAIGGFDPQFRVAGDDVDICWRVRERGWSLGFSPTATVYHHRRDSLRAYWKQQVGYGKAEALLERKWPDKYNAAGHLTWGGRVYNTRGLTPLWWRRGRIYQGTWGTAAYQQRLYQPASSWLSDLPLLPEWYLVIAFLAVLSVIGVLWKPLLAAIPIFSLAVGLSIALAGINAAVAASSRNTTWRKTSWKVRATGLLLHLMHPLARLYGRLEYGLHPWRRRGTLRVIPARTRTLSIWSEQWRSTEEWLGALQAQMRAEGVIGFSGNAFDNWDLEIQGGMLGGVRTRMALEEHGAGRQIVRFKIWPRRSRSGFFLSALMALLAAAAGVDHSWAATGALGAISLLVGGRMLYECSIAMHKLAEAIQGFQMHFERAAEVRLKSVGAIAEQVR